MADVISWTSQLHERVNRHWQSMCMEIACQLDRKESYGYYPVLCFDHHFGEICSFEKETPILNVLSIV